MIVYFCLIPFLLFAVQFAPYLQMNAIAPQKYKAVVGPMTHIHVSSLFFLLVQYHSFVCPHRQGPR